MLSLPPKKPFINTVIHRYEQNADDLDAAATFDTDDEEEDAAATFYFSRDLTKGPWFTVLKYKRARDNVLCHVLLVVSEGSDGLARTQSRSSTFDDKLFAVAKMQSQILMLHPRNLKASHSSFSDNLDGSLRHDVSMIQMRKQKDAADSAVKRLPAKIEIDMHDVEYLLSIGVGKFFCRTRTSRKA